MVSQDKPILFFDGVCNLCNGFVDFLLKIGGEKCFRFASLQGETAKKLLPAENLQRLNSVIFYADGRALDRSSAILAIIARLAMPWRILLLFRLIPKGMRDLLYDLVARNRYTLFGKRDQCRLPTIEERELFLP